MHHIWLSSVFADGSTNKFDCFNHAEKTLAAQEFLCVSFAKLKRSSAARVNSYFLGAFFAAFLAVVFLDKLTVAEDRARADFFADLLGVPFFFEAAFFLAGLLASSRCLVPALASKLPRLG